MFISVFIEEDIRNILVFQMIFLGELFRNIRVTVTNTWDVPDLINKVDKNKHITGTRWHNLFPKFLKTNFGNININDFTFRHFSFLF